PSTGGWSITASGNVPPPDGESIRTVLCTTVPERGGVRLQSTIGVAAALADVAGINSTAPTIRALASALVLFTSFLLAIRAQQLAEGRVVEPRLRVEAAQPEFEWIGAGLLVDELHLLDEPVQPEPHRRVGDAVLAGQLLQR